MRDEGICKRLNEVEGIGTDCSFVFTTVVFSQNTPFLYVHSFYAGLLTLPSL